MPNDASSLIDNTQQTFSVYQLNRKVKSLLEVHFPLMWVEGEISNISRPGSGHWYFTLKDSQAQVNCAMFKRRNQQISFVPKAGDHIRVRARVSLYEGRGDYQLIIEHMEQAGFGLLQKRFNELKEKLLQEGLFDGEQKQTLPVQTQHLAVVTSPTGAAIRDVLSVLKRRFPAMPVTIISAPVQGDEAPQKLINALQIADRDEQFDVILLCRGGGSIEDLWAFNNEALARAIGQSSTPIVNAVGHEVDFTIADFVADLRAPTPSAAAEMLSPNREDIIERFLSYRSQLQRRIKSHINTKANTVHNLSRRLKHPRDKLDQWHQRLDQLEIRLSQAITKRNQNKRFYFETLSQRLSKVSPHLLIKQKHQHLQELEKHLQRNLHINVNEKKQHYHRVISQLDIVSPIATLKRGYSISLNADQKILRSVNDVKTGEVIKVKLGDGELTSTVQDKQMS